MDSKMEIEIPEMHGNTGSSLVEETTNRNEQDKQAYIQKGELPEVTPSATRENELMQDAPPLTSALEALLGGLDSPPRNATDDSIPEAQPLAVSETSEISKLSVHDPMAQDEPTTKDLEPAVKQCIISVDTITENVISELASAAIPGLASRETLASADAENRGEIAAESLQTGSATNTVQTVAIIEDEQEHPEWEVDSSPIESSSDDSSDESSSEESEEGENAYKLLSPEEQARILMQEDGGSDDEGANKSKSSGNQLRTKNEVAEVVIPKPDIIITEIMPIRELGIVEGIVENTLLIKANTSGEYKVLENQSVLCLQDRTVIGVVSETIGRVQQPYYSVLFTNATEVKEAGLEIGTKVFYSEQHSTYVFTKALKAFKGSDASNLHDEEVGDDEMEFSDDEAEAEHKRKVKQKRMEKRGGVVQQNGASSRGGHPLQQHHTPYDASKGLSYDDNDDGPYKTLSRPAGYANTVGRSEAPEEGAYQVNHDRPQSGDHQYRGRGRGDRGDRGRGRGDRGRGRGRGGNGGYQDRPSSSNGHSLAPQNQRNLQQPQFQGNYQQPPFQPYQQPAYSPPAMPQNFYPPQPYSPHQPQMTPWQQSPQQPFQGPWPNIPLPPSVPGLNGGAYINPAFFNNQQHPNAPQQQGHHNQWNQQPKQQ